jgi:hypothetical protein
MENQIINLELTVAEVNMILRVLGKHPFDEVAQLIIKLKQQGEAQLQIQQGEFVEQAIEQAA